MLDEEAVRIYLTEVIGEEEKELLLDNYSNLDQTSKVSVEKYTEKTLYKGTVYANDNYEKNFRLRMWIDENTDFSPVKDEQGNDVYPYNNKEFTVTVNVYANGKVVTDEQIDLQSSTDIELITTEEEKFTKVEDEDYAYEVSLPNGTENTTIQVVPENENAEVTVEKIDSLVYRSKVMRLSRTEFYDLQTGDNYFKVTITSENKRNRREFKINVFVERESINTLEKLEVEGYEISPKFDKEIETYEVTTEEESINVIVETTSELATASVIGNEELIWGENIVSILVTAEDGTTKRYKITVNNEKPSAPTITGGSTNWVSSIPTISVSKQGEAVSGIKHYEYYKSTDSTNPIDTTNITGTTSGNITVSDEGTNYIWYRTVSNNGYKSNWSEKQTVKLDTKTPSAPTITGGSGSWSSTAKTISVQTKASATSGIDHYQYCISTSTSSCNGTWTDLASGVTSVSISTNGTRYIYFRGVSGSGTPGTASSYQTTMIDTGTPSAPTITGGSGSWSGTAKTISVSSESTATSGISHYQYCISTSKSSCDGTWTNLAAGTKSVSISTNGTRYIYFRGVSVVGTPGTASAYQVTVIDTGSPSAPTITGGSGSWSSAAKTISVSTESTALSGIGYYQYCIATSTNGCNATWTNLSSGTKSVSISTNGTRYIYFRAVSGVGRAGAESVYQTTMIDTGTPSAPTITGGSGSWSSAAKTISVSTAASATSGISYYQYCISTSTSSCNGTWTNLAAGTKSVSISTNGTRYIYFRGVSGVGRAGTASAYQTTVIDTSNPTVTVSVSGKVATFTITDNIGTVGYGVNQSTTTQPSYTSYATTNGTRTWTASAAGTYQVWVKDNAGRTARAQFTIAASAFSYAATPTTSTYTATPVTSNCGRWKLKYGSHYYHTCEVCGYDKVNAGYANISGTAGSYCSSHYGEYHTKTTYTCPDGVH